MDGSTGAAVDDVDEGPDEIVEQWLVVEDEHGKPVDGYKYDLLEGTFKHALSAHVNSGATIKIRGGGELRMTMWLHNDSAERA